MQQADGRSLDVAMCGTGSGISAVIIAFCVEPSRNRISGYPDFRISGYLDFRQSGNPDFRISEKSRYPKIRIFGYPEIRKLAFGLRVSLRITY